MVLSLASSEPGTVPGTQKVPISVNVVTWLGCLHQQSGSIVGQVHALLLLKEVLILIPGKLKLRVIATCPKRVSEEASFLVPACIKANLTFCAGAIVLSPVEEGRWPQATS